VFGVVSNFKIVVSYNNRYFTISGKLVYATKRCIPALIHHFWIMELLKNVISTILGM